MLVISKQADTKPLVYFVGLSAKPRCEHLDSETRTGDIIEQIIQCLPSIHAVKTNLVRIPPVDSDGNLRYPNLAEMQSGWNELQNEIDQSSPDLIVALGHQVSCFLRSQFGILPAKPRFSPTFSQDSYLSQVQSSILSIHHPSFVYVYRRKEVKTYVANVVASISSLTSWEDKEVVLLGMANNQLRAKHTTIC